MTVVLLLLGLFGLGMSGALWGLLQHQQAYADTLATEEAVGLGLKSIIYVTFGLSALLSLSTLSTILLFWWQKGSKG